MSIATAQHIYDIAPLGAIIRYSDGQPQPPARFTRKLDRWKSSNDVGRLVKKQAESHSGNYTHAASFTLHTGDFGSRDVIVLKTFKSFTVSTTLHFEIVERPNPANVRILLEDWSGANELIHLAENQAAADAWLLEHPHPKARFESECLVQLPDPLPETHCKAEGI